jgi:hypothetical protein
MATCCPLRTFADGSVGGFLLGDTSCTRRDLHAIRWKRREEELKRAISMPTKNQIGNALRLERAPRKNNPCVLLSLSLIANTIEITFQCWNKRWSEQATDKKRQIHREGTQHRSPLHRLCSVIVALNTTACMEKKNTSHPRGHHQSTSCLFS